MSRVAHAVIGAVIGLTVGYLGGPLWLVIVSCAAVSLVVELGKELFYRS